MKVKEAERLLARLTDYYYALVGSDPKTIIQTAYHDRNITAEQAAALTEYVELIKSVRK